VKTPIICLVTDGRGDVAGLLDRIRAAAKAGVDLVQIREPELADRELFEVTHRACDAAPGTPTRIVVNERLDVALAANAHGVHLRGSSFSAARTRAAAGGQFLIGRSVHTLDEAIAVECDGGCDYLLFGTVFASPSKPAGHRVAGVDALREVCARVRLPVVAIGGVTAATVGEVSAAGAAGIAAISLFGDVESIPSTVELMRRRFDT
jgi:thiamine-phosphate pyrophosphorylase